MDGATTIAGRSKLRSGGGSAGSGKRQHVFHVDQAENVVQVALKDRQARMVGFADADDDVGNRRLHVDRGNIDPRHHHVFKGLAAQAQGVFQDQAFGWVDGAVVGAVPLRQLFQCSRERTPCCASSAASGARYRDAYGARGHCVAFGAAVRAAV